MDDHEAPPALPPAAAAEKPAPLTPIVGTIGRPFQKGDDPRRNLVPPVKAGPGRPLSQVRALARQAFQKVRPFAILMEIARTATKERDRIEALKMLALMGYKQDIFTGVQQGGGGGVPLPSGEVEEEAVQYYLPDNGRADKKETA